MTKLYRYCYLSALAFALSQQVAMASSSEDVIVSLGIKILNVVLTLAGVAAAVGGAAVGLRLIVGSATGSSYAMSQAIFALMGVVGGLALALLGPKIGEAIITSVGATKSIVVP